MRKILLTLLKAIFGVVLLVILLNYVGFNEVYSVLKQIKLKFVPLMFCFYTLNFLIGALNIYILLKPLNAKIGFLKLFRYYMLSWSVGLFVPGKIGEFSLVLFLKRDRVSVGEGMAITLIDKMTTMIVLSAIAILGFLVFFTPMHTVKLAVILIGGCLVVLFLVVSELSRGFIKKYILRGYAKRFSGFSRTFFRYFKKEKKVVLANFFITVAKWVISSMIVYSAFMLFTQEAPRITDIILISGIVSISALLPLTISGLGVKESIAVFMYSLVGVKASVTAGVYLVLLVVCYLTAAVMISSSIDIIRP